MCSTQKAITCNEESLTKEDSCEGNEIFQSEEHMKKSLTRLCYGDLYLIGRLWIGALKAVLVGARMCLIPTVQAAKKAIPQKPPKMRYRDLPIYQSPHAEFKEYQEDLYKCGKLREPILQTSLQPSVSHYRKEFSNIYCEVNSGMKNIGSKIKNDISETKQDLKRYMRNPENLQIRQAATALGAATGFLIAYRKGIPTKIFYTGVGGFTIGALSFPKESDEAFREISHHTARTLIGFYNLYCGKNAALQERLTCKKDLPPMPKTRRKEECPRGCNN